MAIRHDYLQRLEPDKAETPFDRKKIAKVAENMSVVQLLREWGAWGASQRGGYPSMSPMFGERALKTPLYCPESAPPEMLAIEAAIRKIDLAERVLLIQKYQLRMPWREICGKRHLSRSSYFRKIEEAHAAVRKTLG